MSPRHVLQATERIECPTCSLLILPGDDIVLTDAGWLHILCADREDQEAAADRYWDRIEHMQRDEGLHY